ncbi:ArsR/SmtB family transcription factor [Leucobacter sp. NPDC058333]|uniref:ArsR/SmtB family transcription factor n=1 Tax=Leucobacter sp. NPDC058333 TaxID=3346450 RepID=UPI003660F82E
MVSRFSPQQRPGVGGPDQSGDSDALSDAEVNRIFRALADATRRDIVRRTLTAAASISELAADYDMSFAAVQKHVAVLEAADLVARTPQGRERIIRGNPETIRRAQRLLDHFEQLWRARIDRLDAFLAEEPGGAAGSADSLPQ